MGLPWENESGVKKRSGGPVPKAYSKRLITRENGYSIDLSGSNSAMGTFKNTKPLMYNQPKTPYDLLQQPTVLRSRDMNINKYVEKTKVSEFHEVNRKGRVFQLGRSKPEAKQTRKKPSVPIVEPTVENTYEGSNNEMITYDGGSETYSVSSGQSSARSQSRNSTKPKRVSTRKPSATRKKRESYSSSNYEEPNGYNESPVEYEFYSSETKGGDAFSQNSARSNSSSSSRRSAPKKKTRKPSKSRKQNPAPPVSQAPPTFSNNENPPEYDEGTVRIECSICGRKFNEDRIEKHRNICSKSTNKKRKVFSTRAQRQEKEARKLQVQQVKEERRNKRTGGSHESKPVGKKIPKWKLQHMEFQKILKAGKGDSSTSSYNMTAEEAEVMEQLDSRVPCPHCGRKFNETVAERHIPKCRNIINKPTTLKRKTQTRTISSKAPRSTSRVGATTRATSHRSTSRNSTASTNQSTYNRSRVQSSGYGRQSSVPKSTTRSKYRTSSNTSTTSRYSSNLPSRYRT
mmetsp:Transcript_266/g.492  ORF Transcript_266/g.492 Transcript_266/m.492 type:complete len:515 (+) Transcript_266:12-1556(+)